MKLQTISAKKKPESKTTNQYATSRVHIMHQHTWGEARHAVNTAGERAQT